MTSEVPTLSTVAGDNIFGSDIASCRGPHAVGEPCRQCWRPPYIYSDVDIGALIAWANTIRQRLAAATHGILIGLLAVTGMRVGEALRLD